MRCVKSTYLTFCPAQHILLPKESACIFPPQNWDILHENKEKLNDFQKIIFFSEEITARMPLYNSSSPGVPLSLK